MHEFNLSILLFIAIAIAIVPYFANALRLPTLAVEMLFGAVAKHFGWLDTSLSFELAAQIGFCYLMFIAGLEVSFRQFLHLKASELRKILFFYVLLYALSLLIAKIFDLSSILALIISAMSVGLISVLYKEFDTTPKWLHFAMVLAALGEIISIVLMTIANSLIRSSSYWDVLFSVGAIALFLLSFVLIYYIFNAIFWWLPQLKEVLMPSGDKAARNLRLCFSVWLFLIVLMIKFDFEIALGAFLAGVFISSFFGHKKEIESKLSALGNSFLIPIFFIYIGTKLNFDLLSINLLLKALGIVFLMLLVRILAAFVFYKTFRQKSFLIAATTSMPLTLLIATANLGYKLGHIDEELFLAIVLTALIQAVLYIWLLPKLALRIETNYTKV